MSRRHHRFAARAQRLLDADEWQDEERERLIRLMTLFADLGPPPDPLGLLPDYAALHEQFLATAAADDGEALEESFLRLYCHVHGHAAPYTPAERERVDETGGYWSHAGGISPILKAGPFLTPASVSADLGAGNGLQGLLLQKLDPHRRTVQVEISSRMVAAGRALQDWLAIDSDRVEWIVGDVLDVSITGIDFLYLYRPVRPEGEGRRFYERLAQQLGDSPRPVTIFSIADCLRDFLPPSYEVFYRDGHLTCFRRK